MKHYLFIILGILLIIGICVTVTACKKANTDPPVSGGWGKVSSPAVTEQLRTVVAKAGEEAKADYEPLAYLESQIVAGKNHLVLCKRTDNSGAQVVIVTIYEDLSGNCKITSEQKSSFTIPAGDLMGGWTVAENPEIDDALQAAFKKANHVLAGAQYTPRALVATQVVAGTNYCTLCEITATVPDAAPQYCLAVLYEDLNGNVSISDTLYFK